MKIATLVAAATILAGTAASAQQAYITQLGSDNDAVNVSVQNVGNANGVQVIAQEGNGLSAANVNRGRNNQAYAFQQFGPVNDPAGTGTSLIFQTGQVESSTFGGGTQNMAVNVQLGGGAEQATMVSQTIQAGNRNTAINWTQTRGQAVPRIDGATIGAPSLSLTSGTLGYTASVTSVVPPFGSATVSYGDD